MGCGASAADMTTALGRNRRRITWSKLAAGGSESACGWLKDKFGMSWQVVPEMLMEFVTGPDRAKAERVTKAFMQMRKFDIAKLQQAADGKAA